MKAFADAASWIALINTGDFLHTEAHRVEKELRQKRTRIVTSEFVLLEVADALASPLWRVKAADFIAGLRLMPHIDIVPVSTERFERGLQLYRSRADKGWSLTDCISFEIMYEQGITDAFTSDHHFEQAGFRKLL